MPRLRCRSSGSGAPVPVPRHLPPRADTLPVVPRRRSPALDTAPDGVTEAEHVSDELNAQPGGNGAEKDGAAQDAGTDTLEGFLPAEE